MNTGEGKTITAALAATAVALTGVPVHVISVNDYLVHRDSDTLQTLYREFGLSLGTSFKVFQGTIGERHTPVTSLTPAARKLHSTICATASAMVYARGRSEVSCDAPSVITNG